MAFVCFPLYSQVDISDCDVAWENADSFFGFVTSDEFKAFGSSLKPYALAPPDLQLYETNVGPSDVFAATLTEVWQVKLGEGEKTRQTCNAFLAAVESSGGVKSSSGTRLNHEEKPFVGIIGWNSVEVSPVTLLFR